MVNKFASAVGTVIAVWLAVFVIAFLFYGPHLISIYYPPFTNFKVGKINITESGAYQFEPTINKVWCDWGSGSWWASKDGISEQVSLRFPNDKEGSDNRPPGPQTVDMWEVDMFAAPDAQEHYGVIENICLGFLRVTTKVGPFPIQK